MTQAGNACFAFKLRVAAATKTFKRAQLSLLKANILFTKCSLCTQFHCHGEGSLQTNQHLYVRVAICWQPKQLHGGFQCTTVYVIANDFT